MIIIFIYSHILTFKFFLCYVLLLLLLFRFFSFSVFFFFWFVRLLYLFVFFIIIMYICLFLHFFFCNNFVFSQICLLFFIRFRMYVNTKTVTMEGSQLCSITLLSNSVNKSFPLCKISFFLFIFQFVLLLCLR